VSSAEATGLSAYALKDGTVYRTYLTPLSELLL
jgi:hypothetical protein